MTWFIMKQKAKSKTAEEWLVNLAAYPAMQTNSSGGFFTNLLQSAQSFSSAKKVAVLMLCMSCYLPVWSQTVVGKSNKVYVKVSKEITGEKAALSYSQVIFKDPNKTQAIDPAEETTVDFTIKNEGKASSQNLLIKAYSSNEIKGLIFANEIKLDGIEPGKTQDISIPITSSRALESGTANIIIEIKEEYEYDPDQIEINILTEEVR